MNESDFGNYLRSCTYEVRAILAVIAQWSLHFRQYCSATLQLVACKPRCRLGGCIPPLSTWQWSWLAFIVKRCASAQKPCTQHVFWTIYTVTNRGRYWHICSSQEKDSWLLTQPVTWIQPGFSFLRYLAPLELKKRWFWAVFQRQCLVRGWYCSRLTPEKVENANKCMVTGVYGTLLCCSLSSHAHVVDGFPLYYEAF